MSSGTGLQEGNFKENLGTSKNLWSPEGSSEGASREVLRRGSPGGKFWGLGENIRSPEESSWILSEVLKELFGGGGVARKGEGLQGGGSPGVLGRRVFQI